MSKFMKAAAAGALTIALAGAPVAAFAQSSSQTMSTGDRADAQDQRNDMAVRDQQHAKPKKMKKHHAKAASSKPAPVQGTETKN